MLQNLSNINLKWWSFLHCFFVTVLTAQVSKGKSVIQEMKRTCSQNSSMINGPEFVERHLRQHVADIKAVITVSLQVIFISLLVGYISFIIPELPPPPPPPNCSVILKSMYLTVFSMDIKYIVLLWFKITCTFFEYF